MILKRWAPFLLVVILPLLPVIAGKTWPWQNLLVIAVAALAIVLWGIGERKAQPDQGASPACCRPDAIDLALVAFVVLQALSIFPSVYRFATELYVAKVVALAITFWLFRYGVRDRRMWSAALWCVMLGGLLLGVLGLQEYVRTVKFLHDTSWRVFGPMFNPNIAAGYLLLTIFPAVALLFGSRSRGEEADEGAPVAATSKKAVPVSGSREKASRGRRDAGGPRLHGKTAPAPPAAEVAPAPRYAEIAALFAGLLMFATILLTGSKGALAALLLGAVLFALVAFQGRGGRARFMRLGVLAFVIGTILLAFALPPLRARLVSAFGWQSHSTVFRAYTWRSTLKMIEARPLLGFGGGTFENIQPRYAIAGFTRDAHQSFLQIAAECGLPALLAGLLWGVLLLRGLYRRAQDVSLALGRYAAAGAFAALAASGLEQMADYAWYIPAVGLTFFALAGLALASPDTEPGLVPVLPLKSPTCAPAVRRWLPLAFGLALLAWSGVSLCAEMLATQAQVQISAGDYPQAVSTLQQAARLNPGQAQFQVQIAKIEEAMAAHGDREPLTRAIEARQRATVLQPTEPVNYLSLSGLYEQAGDLPAALKAVQEAMRWYPTYPRGLAQLAQLQDRMGQHEAALATYRHLVEVYHSPVGQVQAVDTLYETAFANAWIALGEEAARQHNDQEALGQYRQATDLLSVSVGTERSMSEAMAAGGEAGWGHLSGDTDLAGTLLQQLQKSPLPVSGKLMVRLHHALGDQDEAQRLLRLLSDGKDASPSGKLTQAWATLELAKALPKEQQEEAKALAKKGTSQAGELLAQGLDKAAADEGWQPADTADLRQLVQWAKTMGSGGEPPAGS